MFIHNEEQIESVYEKGSKELLKMIYEILGD